MIWGRIRRNKEGIPASQDIKRGAKGFPNSGDITPVIAPYAATKVANNIDRQQCTLNIFNDRIFVTDGKRPVRNKIIGGKNQ
jgi:hypothetical protein